MSAHKEVFHLNAPLPVCAAACRKALGDLQWKVRVQSERRVVTLEPLFHNALKGNPCTLEITLEASSPNLTAITYNGTSLGFGKNMRINNAISIVQQRLEIHVRAEAFGGYLLTSDVSYSGGHPLIPKSGTVMIGLTNTDFAIHSLVDGSVYSIPLLSITRVSTGKPKTAREIYDEEQSYTIDVTESSPFLSIAFMIDSYTYIASFEAFHRSTPQEWANQITALQYQRRLRVSSFQTPHLQTQGNTTNTNGCTICGRQNRPGARYCAGCGNSL